jgi:uncharacterized pyridoxamine 5'-phosphate oxidase family protein
MKTIDMSEISKLLKVSNGKLYISCSGEEDYPNVSVREVALLEDDTFGYYDEDGTRTVELMKNRPNITLFVENDRFHGIKVKAKALFSKELEIGIKSKYNNGNKKFNNPVAVIIVPEEVFPY